MLVKVQAIAKGVPGCTPYFDSSDTIISNGLDTFSNFYLFNFNI